jgi:hypothetical protein
MIVSPPKGPDPGTDLPSRSEAIESETLDAGVGGRFPKGDTDQQCRFGHADGPPHLWS